MNTKETSSKKQLSAQSENRDFFERFRASKNPMKIAPIFAAFALSLGIVGFMNSSGGNFSHMMASVAQIGANETVSYPADLVLEQDADSLVFTFGATAQDVASVEGILLMNPEVAVQLSGDSEGTVFEALSDGMFRFVITPAKKDIFPGTKIGKLRIEGEYNASQITLVDTQFVSGENRYNLSNIVR